MLTYIIRRFLLAIPTLLFISLIIFLLIDLAPGSPLSQIPLTIPPDVRAKLMQSLGANEPVYIRYLLWLKQFFVVEPLIWFDHISGANYAHGMPRILSWQSRSPVMDVIAQRLPQTLLVVGSSYVIGTFVAIPVGAYSAYRQYSWFDQLSTFIAMLSFSVPTFFTGLIFILVFAVYLQWFPSIYNTNLTVVGWSSFVAQLKQMAMPVMVLSLYNAGQICRYMRASMIENLNQDYVRTARSKGMSESTVILKHILRNSLIPVITVIALGLPSVFGGAIITEQVFRVNGIGSLLIGAIQASDLPMVQTITFIFAILIVLFNIIADILYAILDPRIRYE